MNTKALVRISVSERNRRRAYTGLFAVVLLAAAVLCGGCKSKDDALPSFPTPPPAETQDWLFGVYGTAADDIYVCGNKGAMYRFDGMAWNSVPMGSTLPIVDIAEDPGAHTLYAVGHAGRIWRNSGSGWSSMDSGTSQNLYGIGLFDGDVHAVGHAGAIRRLGGGSWGGVGGSMLILDENSAALDTLYVEEDVAALVTVNHYFLGGAFYDPDFEDDLIGIAGTKGMVLAGNDDPDLGADWILRPLIGEDPVLAPSEWVLCTTSDPAEMSRNYLGTSEGWLFRLVRDDDGRNVWSKFYPSVTREPAAGINDIWLDDVGNIYLVTDDGQIVFQPVDYDYADGGERIVLYDGVSRLTGIWGTDPENLFIVGFMESTVMRASHDQLTHDFTVQMDALEVSEKSAAPLMVRDHLDRPLR